MKIISTLISVFCFSLISFAQTDTIVFQKKSNGKKIYVSLPHDFDIITKKNEYKFGKAFAQSDSTISLTYHNIDSIKWASITNNTTFSRKTKKFKLDSLYKADSVIYCIDKENISFMKFGVNKTRPRIYQAVFWTSMTLFFTASGLLITAAAGPPEPDVGIRTLKTIPYPLTFGIVIYTSKKRIRTDKWEIK